MKQEARKNLEDPRQYFSGKYLILSVSLSLISLFILIYFTYTPGVFDQISLKRIPGLLIALSVAAMRIWFFAAKIRFLSEKRLSWAASLRVVLTWDSTSSITPSTIGGAPLATYAMTRENIPLGQSGAIILFAIMLDQLWLMMLIPALFFLGFYFEVIPGSVGWIGYSAMLMIYSALLLYAAILVYGVFKNPAILKKAVNLVFRLPVLNRYREKIAQDAEILEATSHQLRKKPFGFVFKAFGISTLSWLAKALLPTAVILSFVPADIFLSMLRSLAMMLPGMFMPTPGGSGGVEGLFALFQGPLIEQKGFIGITVFAWRILSFYLTIVAGLMVLSWYLNKKVVDSLAEKKAKSHTIKLDV